MKALALGLMAYAFAGCNGDKVGRVAETIKPAGKPPAVQGVSDKPPAAWVKTARGAHWLGYSSYCWVRACVDFIGPRCGDARTPKLHLTRGEVVRFHLGFAPAEVAILPGRGSPVRLKNRQDPTWRVRSAGVFTIFARAKRGGDASYIGCTRFN